MWSRKRVSQRWLRFSDSRSDKVSPQSITGAGEIGGSDSMYLSGNAGSRILEALRYHLKAHSVPVRYVLLKACISAVVQILGYSEQ